MGPHVNENFFPLVFHRQRMEAENIPTWPRPMLRDVRHLAPEPCTTCNKLEFARDDMNWQGVIGCKNVGECPVIQEVDGNMPYEGAHFLDFAPNSRVIPENCLSCAYQAQSIDNFGRMIFHCNRREQGVEYCVVRGSMKPLEYEAMQYEIKREEAEREQRELDDELNLTLMQDEKDFGTF